MWVYDLFLVIFGITIGVIAAEPIKKIAKGSYKDEKLQRKRVKLLTNLRQDPAQKKSTAQLNLEVFGGKESEEKIIYLLKEIKESELIRSTERGSVIYWQFDQKVYDRNKHKFN